MKTIARRASRRRPQKRQDAGPAQHAAPPTSARTPSDQPLLALQQLVGNQAVNRLMMQRAMESASVVGVDTWSYGRKWMKDEKGNKARVINIWGGKEHKQGETLQVNYNVRAFGIDKFGKHKKDVSGQEGDYALLGGGKKQFVKIAGLRPQPKGPPAKPGIKIGGIGKRTGEALGLTGTSLQLGDFERTDKVSQLGKELKSMPEGPDKEAKKAEKDQLSDEGTGTDLVVTSIGGGAQVFALVNSIQKLVNAKGGWKKAEAGMDVAVQTVKTGSTVSSIVDKAGKSIYGSKAGFGGQAEGGAQGIEKSTMAAGAIGAAGEILAGIVAAVKRVKAIVDLARKKHKVGTKEKLNMGLSTLKDATSIAKSGVSAAKSIIDVTSASGASEALKTAIPGLGIAIAAVDIIQRAFKFVVDAMNKGRARAQKAAMKAKLAAKLGFTITKKAITAYKGTPRYQKHSAKTKQAIDDYLMTRELQDINSKRMTRQGIKIGLDINDIVSEALNIGGVTAAAGLTMKIAGGAAKLIMPAFRRFKQWGRDQAAKRIGNNKKVGGFYSMFNANKSSDAKQAMREKMVNRMFDMMLSWWNMPDGTKKQKAAKETQRKLVRDLFKSAGMSWTAVQSYQDANELAGDLDTALKARE